MMTEADKIKLDHLARRLPRVGQAFPKSDPNGVEKLQSFVNALIKVHREDAGEHVAAHWRKVADGREAAGYARAKEHHAKTERKRTFRQWFAIWWDNLGLRDLQ